MKVIMHLPPKAHRHPWILASHPALNDALHIIGCGLVGKVQDERRSRKEKFEVRESMSSGHWAPKGEQRQGNRAGNLARGSCHTPAHLNMLTVSTDHWLEGKDCRTLWGDGGLSSPHKSTSRTGFWLATMVLTR